MKNVLTITVVIFIAVTNLNAKSLDFGVAAGIGITNINIANLSDGQPAEL